MEKTIFSLNKKEDMTVDFLPQLQGSFLLLFCAEDRGAVVCSLGNPAGLHICPDSELSATPRYRAASQLGTRSGCLLGSSADGAMQELGKGERPGSLREVFLLV